VLSLARAAERARLADPMIGTSGIRLRHCQLSLCEPGT
jgi:hypothetical protein